MLDHGETIDFESNGQRWRTGWHRVPDVPAGQWHGAAGLCVTDGGQVVMISADNLTWDFPAGRPEGAESPEATLRREVAEEACATVRSVRLLGFSRGVCLEGHERGFVLVRSIWRAEVELEPWLPRFETRGRRLVSPAEALRLAFTPWAPFWRRALFEAGLTDS